MIRWGLVRFDQGGLEHGEGVDEGGSLYRHDSLVLSCLLSCDGQTIQAPPHLLPPPSLLYLKVHLRLRLLDTSRHHHIVGYTD